MRRDLWGDKFLQSSVPGFPCPRCTHGTVRVVQGSLQVVETLHSKIWMRDENSDWDHRDQKFCLLLQCDDTTCGEIVTVTGQVEYDQIQDDEYGWQLSDFLAPKSMYPAPPMIQIPKKSPDAVKKELKLAFQIYWADPGASAGRLRTSAERLLDHFKIKKTQVVNGKRVPFSLNNRINAFESVKPGFKGSLHALRIIGNLGTHQGANSEPLLDAFAVYEDALKEIFGEGKSHIAKLVKKITKTKGVYKY
ncbi:DUF4145 domain-containing protein [Methylorubrum sp. SB2]|uniref:DUF4145 domain-containing protein n=1 Tax=Methylorubrum subtropicum TaxID=3138812 RepID=UPI00313E88B8